MRSAAAHGSFTRHATRRSTAGVYCFDPPNARLVGQRVQSAPTTGASGQSSDKMPEFAADNELANLTSDRYLSELPYGFRGSWPIEDATRLGFKRFAKSKAQVLASKTLPR
jgi:hypothetical protein